MKSFVNILIIGSGNIGSRHLQGALKSKFKLMITIVDTNIDSIELSKFRSNDIKLGNSKTYIEYTQKIPTNKNYEIAIISTNAVVRAEVTKILLSHNKVKYIIFEKVLFQKEENFKSISKLLKKKNVTAWVNCPRRTWNVFQKIKKTLNNNKVIEMTVCGSSWGMACNSIHFIDLFSYLVDNYDIRVTKKMFSNNILKSKRGGKFYEVNGEIAIKAQSHSLKIICEESKKNLFLNVKIKNEKFEYLIDEYKSICNSFTDGLMKQRAIKIPMQSDETGKVIDGLISRKYCKLTPYHESCKHHMPLINSIREHLSKILKSDLDKCPIT